MKGRKFVSIGAALALMLALTLVPVASPVMAAEGTATGSFAVGNAPPNMQAVELYTYPNLTDVVTAITPQVEYYLKVRIHDGNGVDNIVNVTAKIYYDSAGSNPSESGFTTGNTQNVSILTWNSTGWFIDAGSGTSWAIISGNCTKPTTGNTGDWKFAFKPGKVATESTVGDWDLHGRGTDNASATDGMYCYNKTMNWYGEINLITTTIGFGTVAAGSNFDAAGNNVTDINATYIANGDYDEKVAASSPWTGPPNATLNVTEGTLDVNEFALKANDSNVLATAVLVTISPTYNTTANTGTQTIESGDNVNTNTQWIKLAATFGEATYNGTLYYQIANG
jgi:hypothetical protein